MLPPADRPSGGTHGRSASDGAAAAVDRQERQEWGETAYGPVLEVPSGLFAGSRMRFSLKVAQQPIHGRRKTDKDRRPLAHPPILRFRASIVKPTRHGWEEEEVNANSFEPSLLVCAAELCDPSSVPPRQPLSLAPSVGSSAVLLSTTSDPSLPATRDTKGELDISAGRQRSSSWQVESMTAPGAMEDNSGAAGPGPQTIMNRMMNSEYSLSAAGSGTATPVASSGDIDLTRRRARSRELGSKDDESERSMKRPRGEGGRNLFGSLHVQGVRVPAPEGGVGLWFLFTDLTVRQEGTYCLHFRVYDILSVQPGSADPAPPLCECFSQVFRVYSPRNFPGLPKPTELAKHFAQQGFKLNTRKNERTAPSPEGPDEGDAETEADRPGPQPIQSSEGSSANTMSTLASTVASSHPSVARRTSSDLRMSASSISSNSINALLSSQPGLSSRGAEQKRDRE